MDRLWGLAQGRMFIWVMMHVRLFFWPVPGFLQRKRAVIKIGEWKNSMTICQFKKIREKFSSILWPTNDSNIILWGRIYGENVFYISSESIYIKAPSSTLKTREIHLNGQIVWESGDQPQEWQRMSQWWWKVTQKWQTRQGCDRRKCKLWPLGRPCKTLLTYLNLNGRTYMAQVSEMQRGGRLLLQPHSIFSLLWPGVRIMWDNLDSLKVLPFLNILRLCRFWIN